ncbi:GUN4 domain-containing protein [Microcoleus sp. A006_D1]|uniref:GUN4 domain-containing protein n=1 Tax=Microcoleus sp. A006_D1 TaxID=3055267 RepID=UPI002FD5E099
MKSRLCLLILTLLALSLTSCGQQKSSQEIAETVKNSIVLISSQNEGGHGTGFIVPGPKGVCTVLTARHVVEGRSLNLQTDDQKLHKTDSIQTSPNLDLAVVTFPSVGETCPYPSLKLGDSDSVKVYDKIYISGFLGGAEGGKLEQQSVIGFVSKLDVRSEGYGISYDASTFSGMSGSPVLDVNGKVVAVHGVSINGFRWGIPIKTYLANQSNWVNQPIAKAEYSKLEQLLAAGQWKAADEETASKMVEVAVRQKERMLTQEDMENFSCPDLRAMDRLWVKYSNGRFGFSVQKRIYQSLGGTKEYNREVWLAYIDKTSFVTANEIKATYNINAPEGHLPWYFWLTSSSAAIMPRIINCNL